MNGVKFTIDGRQVFFTFDFFDQNDGFVVEFTHPIYVVPLSQNDILRTKRWTPYAAMLANLNDQERGQLRRDVVNSMCEIMRDCDDWEVRAGAHDILTQLKVIHHD